MRFSTQCKQVWQMILYDPMFLYCGLTLDILLSQCLSPSTPPPQPLSCASLPHQMHHLRPPLPWQEAFLAHLLTTRENNLWQTNGEWVPFHYQLDQGALLDRLFFIFLHIYTYLQVVIFVTNKRKIETDRHADMHACKYMYTYMYLHACIIKTQNACIQQMWLHSSHTIVYVEKHDLRSSDGCIQLSTATFTPPQLLTHFQTCIHTSIQHTHVCIQDTRIWKQETRVCIERTRICTYMQSAHIDADRSDYLASLVPFRYDEHSSTAASPAILTLPGYGTWTHFDVNIP